MLTKKDLMQKFQKTPEQYWKVRLFEEKGFVRKQCSCGKNFWTLDTERKVCGDSSCEAYRFIGNPITKKKWDYVQAWKEFEKFFKKEGHTSIPRFPVIDRWRPDLFFTIASIQDFQRIDKGQMVMEYPADPLVVPQVCLRFGDIANVGITGRHHTSFVMPGQHSFGKYWKDRCIELNFKFFNKVMGIPEKELVYIEDLWSMPDQSQFGPSLETVSQGLELVNSVFSQFTKSGNEFKELPVKVIDVGFGHERLVWFTQGTTTGYDAVFGPVAKWMKKQAGVQDSDLFESYSTIAGKLDFDEAQNLKRVKEEIASTLGITVKEMNEAVEPLQALYSIADHSKTLLFAITDGGIPSNVGGGYNLRVILRRALSFIKEFGFDFDIMKIAELHANHLKKMFPELKDGLGQMEKIVNAEEERYEKTVGKATGIVQRSLEKGLGEQELITLYTSHGISPELVEKVATEQGKKFHVPEDFYKKVTASHLGGKKEKEVYEGVLNVDVSSIPATDLLYYQDSYQKEMDAKVLGAFQVGKDYWIALNRTVFYPEGGGQPTDHGIFVVGEKEIPVESVQKIGTVVLHKVGEELGEGTAVKGKLNWERRAELMKMHDATHIIAGACRAVLGKGAWQAGAQKGLKVSRLDITHYKPFSSEELDKIEKKANDAVKKNLEITAKFMPRSEAEGKYGFVLYQGGASPGKEVRVVEIANHDVEACGGTHGKSTGEVGLIKIIRAERIQDGVNRLEFTCGAAAASFLAEMEKLYQDIAAVFKENGIILPAKERNPMQSLHQAAEVFSVDVRQLPRTVERFLKESKEKPVGRSLPELSSSLFAVWKKSRKEQEKEGKEKASENAEKLLENKKGSRVFEIVAAERKDLILIAGEVLKKDPSLTVILANQAGEVVGMSQKEDMGVIVGKLCRQAGGAGGGKGNIAQGKAELSKLLKLMER